MAFPQEDSNLLGIAGAIYPLHNSRVMPAAAGGRGLAVVRRMNGQVFLSGPGKLPRTYDPHDLTRHLAATTMLARSQDPAAVAANTGHCDPGTLMRYYAHTLPDAQQKALTTLPVISCQSLSKKEGRD